MTMRVVAAAWLAAAWLAAGAASAEEAEAAGAAPAVAIEGAAPEGEASAEGEPKVYQFVTGLDFSYWDADAGPTIGGPGLTVGFVLVPKHLEIGFAIGAMLGGRQYTIPAELSFTIPFHVTDWFAPYLKLGPTVLTDKVKEKTTYDFAASFGAGIELLPTGFDWSLYIGGDYSFRPIHEVRHQGGFTVGFHYRV